MAKTPVKAEATLIQAIQMRRIVLDIVGTSPFIMHRYARKAWQEMIYPKGKANTAERATSMKHNPIEEYRECFYRNRDDKSPTLFHLPDGMIKGALSSAALDVPGATRTEIVRLTKIVSTNINLYGVPQLFMSMVRSSDMKRTPDVRTRPIFPRWGCKIELEYKANPLTDDQIIALLGAAGQIIGIGDWRQQKGGAKGLFRVCDYDDPEYQAIIAEGGRAAQAAAYDKPTEYDEDSADIMSWFTAEVARRRQTDGETQSVKRRKEVQQ